MDYEATATEKSEKKLAVWRDKWNLHDISQKKQGKPCGKEQNMCEV